MRKHLRGAFRLSIDPIFFFFFFFLRTQTYICTQQRWTISEAPYISMYRERKICIYASAAVIAECPAWYTRWSKLYHSCGLKLRGREADDERQKCVYVSISMYTGGIRDIRRGFSRTRRVLIRAREGEKVKLGSLLMCCIILLYTWRLIMRCW